MKNSYDSPVRCAITLAAGEGQRLRPLIRRMRGDSLPKQFVNFIGTRSMLEHTFDRVEKLIPTQNLFTVVSQDHLKYREVWHQLSSRSKGTVIIQPENKNTGPGLFLPLRYLTNRYPESDVGIFPSDHFIVEEELFMDHVRMAFHIVEKNPELIVLLGVSPDGPDPDYGYILPGEPGDDPGSGEIRRVSGFFEKPGLDAAKGLIQKGGLWNTFVMVFRAKTMLELLRKTVPSLYNSFNQIDKVIGTVYETKVVKAVYRNMRPVDFSREILECLANRFRSHLTVLRVEGVQWNDWGSEVRILSDLRRMGYLGRFPEVNQGEIYALSETI